MGHHGDAWDITVMRGKSGCWGHQGVGDIRVLGACPLKSCLNPWLISPGMNALMPRLLVFILWDGVRSEYVFV